jgi:hypothetical protein
MFLFPQRLHRGQRKARGVSNTKGLFPAIFDLRERQATSSPPLLIPGTIGQ